MLKLEGATVVFSGGQDSTTCLGWALKYFSEVACITFHYGQKHDIEIEAAARVIAFFEDKTGRKIPHETMHLPSDTFLSTSPLVNRKEQLEVYDNHDQMESVIGNRVEKTFVPMRNAVFLMLAANRAVANGHASIVTGVCEADNANYPDCRWKFITSTEVAINNALGLDPYGVRDRMQILTPLMRRTKSDTVTFALQLHHTYAALAYSHTAYDGTYPPVSKDHASVLRAHGFEEADTPDPLVLRAVCEGLMELPDTSNYRSSRIKWAGDYLSFMGEEA